MIGASAALHISPIPWRGPIAGVRVGRVDGKFVANPTFEQIEQSDCELLVAASRDAIVMVEGEADEMSEEDMIEALLFGHRAVQDTLDLIDRMQQAVGKPKWSFTENSTPAILMDRIRQVAAYKVREACNIADKHARSDRFKAIRKESLSSPEPRVPRPGRADQGRLRGAPLQHDARPGARRRPSPRRSRHAHRASDQHRARRAAARPRLVAVHAR